MLVPHDAAAAVGRHHGSIFGETCLAELSGTGLDADQHRPKRSKLQLSCM